ncbi:MAG: uncharacterized protein JWO59_2139, partial [Chloroflexi bacterium]|nr:uncharacterized protein [Chloroflexota bacterium]
PAADSEANWLEHYEGGWQVLFPNGGSGCLYKGAEMPFHGEASTLPWQYEMLEEAANTLRLRLSVRLCRSPFRIERELTIRDGEPTLQLWERVTNEGGEPLAAMWSHHPAFGEPFLGPACVVDSGARTVWADPAYTTAGSRLKPGSRSTWPAGIGQDGEPVDLRVVPQVADTMAYLGDFEEGWFALSNPDLGFGVAQAWPVDVLPHAWFWQEMRSNSGFPWYRSAYTMAIEPASSIPGGGLVKVMETTGTHLMLEPGESRELTLTTAFFDLAGAIGVEHAGMDGRVILRR